MVEGGFTQFIQVGDALLKIRDRRLYRVSHQTFEHYCRGRWGMSKVHASRLIDAADVVADLVPMGTKNPDGGVENADPAPLPTSERVVRELKKAEPQERAETWKEAVATAPKDTAGKPKVTAKHVEKVVAKRKQAAAVEKPKDDVPAGPLDLAGVPIPDRKSLRDAFENAAKFDEALNLLKRVKALINPLLGDADKTPHIPGGEDLAIERQAVLRDYKNLYTHISHSRPFAVCPHCRGKGCRAGIGCEGRGWMLEQAYGSAPSDLKDAMKTKGAAA